MKTTVPLRMLFFATSASDSVNVPGPGYITAVYLAASAAVTITSGGITQAFPSVTLNSNTTPASGVTTQHLASFVMNFPDTTGGTTMQDSGQIVIPTFRRVLTGDVVWLVGGYTGIAPIRYSGMAIVYFSPE